MSRRLRSRLAVLATVASVAIGLAIVGGSGASAAEEGPIVPPGCVDQSPGTGEVVFLCTSDEGLLRLHLGDSDTGRGGPGMQWVEAHDAARSVFAWLRTDPAGIARPVLVVVNATPSPQYHYRLGVPLATRWEEILNTDATEFGGSGLGNLGGVDAHPVDSHDQHQSIVVNVPPLAVVAFAPSPSSSPSPA